MLTLNKNINFKEQTKIILDNSNINNEIEKYVEHKKQLHEINSIELDKTKSNSECKYKVITMGPIGATLELINKEKNEIILGESHINEQIVKVINSDNSDNKINKKSYLDNSDSEYEYNYKFVVIGAVGATLELFKTKKYKL